MTFFLKRRFWTGQLLLILASTFTPAYGYLPETSQHPAPVSATYGTDLDDVLQPNRPVVRQITSGQVHSIRVHLAAKQFLRVAMSEWSFTAEVAVYDPKGHLVCVTGNRSEGLTPVSLIAFVPGLYRFDIRSLIGAGTYTIKIDELRVSTAADTRRIAAERLYAEAERLRAEETAESIRSAIKKYEAAANISQTVLDHRQEAAARNRIGDLYQILNANKAIEYYRQALEVSRRAQDKSGIAEALNNFGYTHFFLGHTQQALDAATEALKLSREAGDRRAEAKSLTVTGEAHYGFGDMSKALESQNQALALWRELHDTRGEAPSLVACGYAYAQTGEPRKAVQYFSDALALWRAVGSKRGQAATLIALGNIQNKLGEKQDALNLYLQAKRLLDPIGDTSYKAYLHAHMARLYRDMGENKLALENNNRAVDLFRASGNRWGEAEGLLGIGRIYSILGEYRTALDYYLNALDTFRSLKMSRLQAQTLRDIGKTYDALGDGVAALGYYQRTLEILRTGQDQREKAYTLNYMGGVYEKLGNRSMALDYYTQALELSRSISDRQGEASSIYNLAHLDRARGDLDAAREKIEAAIHLTETLRTKVASQDLRASFLAAAHRHYEFYTDVLMELHEKYPLKGYNVMALEVSERGRARSLLELLTEARAGIRQGIDPALLRRELELQRQLNAKVEQRIQLALRKASSEEFANLERELNALTDEFRLLEAQIKVSSPRYAALTHPKPLTLAEMQKVLDGDTILLFYALGEERSFMWKVTLNSIESFRLPSRREVEKVSRRVYELLTARNQNITGETRPQWQIRIRKAEAEYIDASLVLGKMLLGRIASDLGQKRIVVVADGALQYVPFAALPVPTGNKAYPEKELPATAESSVKGVLPPDFVPLIVNHEVVSLPSTSVLASIRDEVDQRRSAPELIAVLADPVFDNGDERVIAAKRAQRGKRDNGRGRAHAANEDNVGAAAIMRRALRSFGGWQRRAGIARLPFSLREANAISEAAPHGEAMLALGFRASRATASNPELAKYRIVHFATHGFINSEHPELSGILLSLFDESGRRQNGFLQLHEIYNLNLPADLVVLSACQTALGKDIRGEGLVGLTRGFMYAGAARVVASLWQVDDAATAELMGEFYKAMFREGLSSAKALQTAQVRMWRQSQWSNPYYWAAFTLQGEWK